MFFRALLSRRRDHQSHGFRVEGPSPDGPRLVRRPALPFQMSRGLPRRSLLLGLLVAAGLASAAEPSATSAPGAATPPPAALAAYAGFGSEVAKQMRMADWNWSDAQFAAFLDGLRASRSGRGYPYDAAAQQLSDQINRRLAELAAPPAGPGRDPIDQYLRQAREGLGMQQTASSLLYLIVQAGGGPRPRLSDQVVVSATVMAADGKTPLPQLAAQHMKIRMSDLIPGLAEGLQLIALGGRAVLVIPPKLSFPAGQWPAGVEVGSPLIFRIELEDIISAGTTP